MATRKPLIVNPDASQIQELPNGDSLDGIANITATGTVQAEQLTSTDDATVTGEITVSGQPSCLLTVPKLYTADNSNHSSTPHQGGTNEKPISFTNTTTNVNCTTSLSSDATVNSGITSITVPSAGTYLVSACISGHKVSGSGTDQIRFALAKSGISTFPNGDTYPTFVFGNVTGTGEQEFNCTFTLPLNLSASDTLSVHLSHIGSTSADIEEGYFSITKLH